MSESHRSGSASHPEERDPTTVQVSCTDTWGGLATKSHYPADDLSPRGFRVVAGFWANANANATDGYLTVNGRLKDMLIHSLLRHREDA